MIVCHTVVWFNSYVHIRITFHNERDWRGISAGNLELCKVFGKSFHLTLDFTHVYDRRVLVRAFYQTFTKYKTSTPISCTVSCCAAMNDRFGPCIMLVYLKSLR